MDGTFEWMINGQGAECSHDLLLRARVAPLAEMASQWRIRRFGTFDAKTQSVSSVRVLPVLSEVDQNLAKTITTLR